MKKILITGASGFLGWHLCCRARKDWDVTGVFFKHPVNIEGVRSIRADLTNFEEMKKIFKEIRPDTVVHAAAQTDVNYCQSHPSESRKINVDASAGIAGLCSGYNAPLVFTSTDLVFDGLNPPYSEGDTVNPVNVYGEHNARAENEVLKRCPKAIVCRMPLMFGYSGSTAESFIQPLIKAMRAGTALKLFMDEFRTPASVRAAVQGIFLALEKEAGTIHLGGKERISRCDFGLLLAEIFGISGADIRACLRRDVSMAAPRPPDVSLDSTKAMKLGFKPLTLRRELEMIRDRL